LKFHQYEKAITVLVIFFPCFRDFCTDRSDTHPQWRPVYHFTPEKNWTNDQNGPIYLNGTFHMYNQQNFWKQVGTYELGTCYQQGPVHWTHYPIAMPETIDKDTTWRFSVVQC
jgi:levanase/fructan beta-fructosidase